MNLNGASLIDFKFTGKRHFVKKQHSVWWNFFDDVFHYFDVVVTILNIEPLTALGPIEESHMVLLSHPVSESLSVAVL